MSAPKVLLIIALLTGLQLSGVLFGIPFLPYIAFIALLLFIFSLFILLKDDAAFLRQEWKNEPDKTLGSKNIDTRDLAHAFGSIIFRYLIKKYGAEFVYKETYLGAFVLSILVFYFIWAILLDGLIEFVIPLIMH